MSFMELESLETKLNEEKRAKESIAQNVKNLEKRAYALRMEIAHARKQAPEYGATDSEGYKQLQKQLQTNVKLERNIALERERLKILSERNADVAEMDLNILSQTELSRFIKQLERIRTDLQSTLREMEFNLDQQSKEYMRLSEMKNLYHAELDLRDRKQHNTLNPLSSTRTLDPKISHASNFDRFNLFN